MAEGHASNASGAKGAGKTFEEILKEEEEYLVESFDGTPVPLPPRRDRLTPPLARLRNQTSTSSPASRPSPRPTHSISPPLVSPSPSQHHTKPPADPPVLPSPLHRALPSPLSPPTHLCILASEEPCDACWMSSRR